jgi:hypothetical protein
MRPKYVSDRPVAATPESHSVQSAQFLRVGLLEGVE